MPLFPGKREPSAIWEAGFKEAEDRGRAWEQDSDTGK